MLKGSKNVSAVICIFWLHNILSTELSREEVSLIQQDEIKPPAGAKEM